jgi:hypothetical protein
MYGDGVVLFYCSLVGGVRSSELILGDGVREEWGASRWSEVTSLREILEGKAL